MRWGIGLDGGDGRGLSWMRMWRKRAGPWGGRGNATIVPYLACCDVRRA